MTLPPTASRQTTYAQQGTEKEANRLIQQIEDALAAIGTRAEVDADALGTAADRIERISRDFAVALRQLAREHKLVQEGVEE